MDVAGLLERLAKQLREDGFLGLDVALGDTHYLRVVLSKDGVVQAGVDSLDDVVSLLDSDGLGDLSDLPIVPGDQG